MSDYAHREQTIPSLALSRPGDDLGAQHRIAEIRKRLVDAAVVSYALTLTVAIPVSLTRALDIGWQPSLSAMVTAMVAFWVVALARRRLHHVLKGGFVVGMGGLFGMLMLLTFGMMSYGIPLLLISAVLTVVFFGARAGLVSSVAGTAVIGAIGWGFAAGGLDIQVDLEMYARTATLWLSATVGFAVLVGVLVATVGRFDRDLRALVTELGRASEGLRELANQDELTGVANRRHFMSWGDVEAQRIRRYGDPGFLAVLDIDRFKNVNDDHGHAMGDETLRCFARLLVHEVREPDHVGRLGGDEFALLLPSTDEGGATTVVNRIRENWGATPIELEGVVARSTVSIGLTQILPDDPSFTSTLDRADVALYAAKDGGRDRVEIAR